MNRTAQVAIASFALAALVFLTTAYASADQRFTLEVSPVFFQDNTGDSAAPPPPGTIPLYCTGGQPGCPNGNPQTTSNLRLDYGLTYQINRRWSVNYAHANLDFSIGRILTITPLSVLSGSINDRIDTGTINYAAGHGLTLSGGYSSHQRVDIAAVPAPGFGNCYLNQEACIGATSNPSSINANDWFVTGAYTFGPHTAYQPPMFKLSASINYWPRVANGNCTGANPQPACGTGGFSPTTYVGSGETYPWSFTWFPLSDFAPNVIRPGTIPFVGYEAANTWFHAENTPETFNVINAGLVQVLPHGLSLSYVYLKFNGRPSSDTVPPPDTIRFAVSIFKLTYDLHF
jgi:hypothetical protein